MSEREPRENPDGLRLTALRCRRVDRQITPEEHVGCPYCFGRLADVRGGNHETFCDYKPGRDPIHFGFPADCERDRLG